MSDPGVYVLLLRLPRSRSIRLARVDRILPRGYYFYVGSAMAGMDARIRRHLTHPKAVHWHIDRLTALAKVHRVFRYATRSRNLECRLARRLAGEEGVLPVPGFGASDCRCSAHLFRCDTKPDFNPMALLRPPDVEGVTRALRRLYPEPRTGKTGSPFRTLVTCVISLRTQDPVTARSARRLFALAGTPAEMARLRPSEISRAIYPAGFYREKGRAIHRISRILLESHGGRVPRSLEALTRLPGVGRKTANLVLGRAFGVPSICVDTHVHRISNRLGWVATDTPEETERGLLRVLPRKHWIAINRVLVRHGQDTCHPTSPRCSACSIETLCMKDRVRRHR